MPCDRIFKNKQTRTKKQMHGPCPDLTIFAKHTVETKKNEAAHAGTRPTRSVPLHRPVSLQNWRSVLPRDIFGRLTVCARTSRLRRTNTPHTKLRASESVRSQFHAKQIHIALRLYRKSEAYYIVYTLISVYTKYTIK